MVLLILFLLHLVLFLHVYHFEQFSNSLRFQREKEKSRKPKTENWRLKTEDCQRLLPKAVTACRTAVSGLLLLAGLTYSLLFMCKCRGFIAIQSTQTYSLYAHHCTSYIIYHHTLSLSLLYTHTLYLYLYLYLSTFNVLWSVHLASRGIPQTEFQNFRVSHWYFPEMCPAWPSRLQFLRIRPSASPFLNADKILGTKYFRF